MKVYKNGKMVMEIIEEVGVLETSSTQKTQVNIVRDDRGKVKVAIQKYWRKEKDQEWNIGKGLFVSGRDAVSISDMLQQAGNKILHIK